MMTVQLVNAPLFEEDEAEEGDPGHQGAQRAGEGGPGCEGCPGVVLKLSDLLTESPRLTDCDAGSAVRGPGPASRLGLTPTSDLSHLSASNQSEEKLVWGVWVE